jgi:hypothetical protein
MAKQALDSYESRILTCQEYSRLWQEFFQFFADDLSDKAFTEEEERQFAEKVTALARKQFQFTQLASPHFRNGADIVRILPSTNSRSTGTRCFST